MLILFVLCSFMLCAQSALCPNVSRFNLFGNIKDTYQVSNDIILILTDAGYVYRSVDGLKTLAQLDNFALPTFTVSETLISAAVPAQALVAGVRTANPSVLYFYGGGGRIWLTADGGATFTVYQTGFEIALPSAEMHQTDSSRLLLIGYDRCCNDGSACADQCNYFQPYAFLSVDTAATWARIAPINNAYQLGSALTWGYSSLEKDWIYLITPSYRIAWSTDLGNSFNIIQTANSILYFFYDEINLAFGYVTDGPTKYGGSPVVMNYEEIVTYPSVGKVMPFTRDNFPITIQDFDKGSIYALVYHNSPNSFGAPLNAQLDLMDLVVANSDNFTDFTLGLSNIMSNANQASSLYGSYDFVLLVTKKSSDPKGIAIANVRQNPYPNAAVSLITFNAALSWQPIPVRECYSAAGCSLHFVGPAQGVSSVYKTFPVGIFLVLGSVGAYQNINDPSFGIYMTRDFGQSWYRIMTLTNYSYIVSYDVDSSGNVVAVVKSDEPTTIYTTFDDGLTWANCTVTDPVADASANITWTLGSLNSESTFSEYYAYEIGSAITTTFFLTATYSQSFSGGLSITGSSFFRYQIASLDNIPICVPSDYETFTLPLDTTQCVYGQAVQYIRKREFSVCQINESIAYLPSLPLSTCACNTKEDYYCGLCAEKNSSNQCIPQGPISRARFQFCQNFDPSQMPAALQTEREQPCPSYTYYDYALNLGDACTVVTPGIENAVTYSAACTRDDTAGAIIGGIIGGTCAALLLIALLTYLFVFWKKNPQIEQAIEETVEAVVVEVKEAAGDGDGVQRV